MCPRRNFVACHFQMTSCKGNLHIGPLERIYYPAGISKDDELLFETQDGEIVSYNLYTNEFRKLSLPAAVYPGFTSATLCLKTLISV
ncbi:hypothetical protein TIFTF001_011804 [Ficus carica]|uniref:Uncharacterized protein n=1 Tax=Ficus carica TaxID=3494 RepID=A0AA88DHY5_FICCA|nr:hypothetical protein TIFTF001_011804 [Ficus carica]